jgi:hypothetical protein
MSDQPPYDWANDPDNDDFNNDPADGLDEFDAEPDLTDEPDDVTAEPNSSGGLDTAPHPVNWRTLSAEDAEYEWLALNEWVDWLRHDFGLPASIVPPNWHQHPELVWELSALHLHWLGAYDPAQHASAPIGWLTDFHAAQQRLREWVALSGTRLDRDRPTRQTIWPGEDFHAPAAETAIVNRDQEFVEFVVEDVDRRTVLEARYLHDTDDETDVGEMG